MYLATHSARQSQTTAEETAKSGPCNKCQQEMSVCQRAAQKHPVTISPAVIGVKVLLHDVHYYHLLHVGLDVYSATFRRAGVILPDKQRTEDMVSRRTGSSTNSISLENEAGASSEVMRLHLASVLLEQVKRTHSSSSPACFVPGLLFFCVLSMLAQFCCLSLVQQQNGLK